MMKLELAGCCEVVTSHAGFSIYQIVGKMTLRKQSL